MVGWILVITCASVACLAAGFPTHTDSERRYKRSPLNARSMMIRGYFRGQPVAGYKFDPEAMMTAYSLGNMVAAGSYQGANLKPACQDCDPQETGMRYPSNAWQQTPQTKPEEEEPPKWNSNDKPQIETPADAEDDEKNEKEERKPKATKKPKRRPTTEEVEDDDEEEGDLGAATFSRFFPMTFNFPGSYRRSGEEQGQSPGLATAISNSFSQGKGAIASSQATAYGSPDPAQIRKSLQSRRRY